MSSMRNIPHTPFATSFLLAGLLTAMLSACAAPKKTPLYHQEEFGDTQTYSRSFGFPAASACEAGRRSLLSQGYIIGKAQTTLVDGTKSFQPEPDQHMEISVHIECAPTAKDGSSSIAFVSAVQDQFALKKTSNSASVGVSVLGSLSLPIGANDDAMVKVASETIRSPEFYNRFFMALERFLIAGDDKNQEPARPAAPVAMPPAAPATAAAVAPAAPVPVPVPVSAPAPAPVPAPAPTPAAPAPVTAVAPALPATAPAPQPVPVPTPAAATASETAAPAIAPEK